MKIESRRVRDRAQAEQLVRDGDLDAALLEGRVVISDEKLPDELDSALQVGQRQVATGATLRRQGLSESATRQVLEPEPLKAETLSGDDDEEQKQFIALAAGILLYMQLLTYGLWVATGVVEEKSSRVVEILLSTLSPRALMAGKIVGLGLLGMGQLLLVVAVGIALALATGSLEPNAGDISPALLVLLWFPLGYALYASLYAATAALVSRQEDLQSATTPLTILILVVVLPVLQRAGGPRRHAGPGGVAGPVLGAAGHARADGPGRRHTGGGGGGRAAHRGHHHPPGAGGRPRLRGRHPADRQAGQAAGSAAD